MIERRFGFFLASIVIASSAALADDGPLTLADVAEISQALDPSSGPIADKATGFRELWDHPEKFLGRRIRVEGVVRRLFHQEATGRLPALVEVWMTNPAGDLFCLLCPEATPHLGSSVTFVGTYLRRIEYRSGDVPRLAPLIVGPEAPRVASPPKIPKRPLGNLVTIDRAIGVGALILVAFALLRNYASRPPRMPDVRGPAPRFLDEEPISENATDGRDLLDRSEDPSTRP